MDAIAEPEGSEHTAVRGTVGRVATEGLGTTGGPEGNGGEGGWTVARESVAGAMTADLVGRDRGRAVMWGVGDCIHANRGRDHTGDSVQKKNRGPVAEADQAAKGHMHD